MSTVLTLYAWYYNSGPIHDLGMVSQGVIPTILGKLAIKLQIR